MSRSHPPEGTLRDQGRHLIVLPQIADRCLVFSEEHRIVAESTPAEILSDRDLLLSVNLIHACSRLPH